MYLPNNWFIMWHSNVKETLGVLVFGRYVEESANDHERQHWAGVGSTTFNIELDCSLPGHEALLKHQINKRCIYVHLLLDAGCQLQIIMMASSIIYIKLLVLVKLWSGFSVRTVTFLFYWSTRHSAMVSKAVSLFKWRNGVGLCCVVPFHQGQSLCLDNH